MSRQRHGIKREEAEGDILDQEEQETASRRELAQSQPQHLSSSRWHCYGSNTILLCDVVRPSQLTSLLVMAHLTVASRPSPSPHLAPLRTHDDLEGRRRSFPCLAAAEASRTPSPQHQQGHQGEGRQRVALVSSVEEDAERVSRAGQPASVRRQLISRSPCSSSLASSPSPDLLRMAGRTDYLATFRWRARMRHQLAILTSSSSL